MIVSSLTKFRRVHAALIALVVAGSAAGVFGQSLREWRKLASTMVDKEIVAAGIKDERVIRAMRETPRHEFVPANQRQLAYYDMALPIGEGQTISPPFIVASMTEAIEPKATDRVLEIGTGSGYQAAILSPLVREVYTIEIVEPLARRAARALKHQGYKNVHPRAGDGYKGWPEAAPFDKIIVTCSPEKVPQPLVDQLRDGGLLVIPVGERYQQTLYLMRKVKGKLESEALRPTLFVPMTGAAEEQREVKPDPTKPQIANGSFEEVIEGDSKEAEPRGWHYQRQLALKMDASAPDGKRFVTFKNDEPGRGAHALQGFGVDGRKVSTLELEYWVRGESILRGPGENDWPRIVVTFYDERRATVGEESAGPFAGTFDWREDASRIPVPLRAREAILRIGLLGAIGEISLDDLRLHPTE